MLGLVAAEVVFGSLAECHECSMIKAVMQGCGYMTQLDWLVHMSVVSTRTHIATLCVSHETDAVFLRICVDVFQRTSIPALDQQLGQMKGMERLIRTECRTTMMPTKLQNTMHLGITSGLRSPSNCGSQQSNVAPKPDAVRIVMCQ